MVIRVLEHGAQTKARTHIREKPVPPELRPVLVLARVDGRISLVVPPSLPQAQPGELLRVQDMSRCSYPPPPSPGGVSGISVVRRQHIQREAAPRLIPKPPRGRSSRNLGQPS